MSKPNLVSFRFGFGFRFRLSRQFQFEPNLLRIDGTIEFVGLEKVRMKKKEEKQKNTTPSTWPPHQPLNGVTLIGDLVSWDISIFSG